MNGSPNDTSVVAFSSEEQLRRSHDTFYNLIQNNPFGVYVVDNEFRLREVSLGSQKVFSNVRPLLGRDFAEVLRIVWEEPFASEAIGRFRHTLATGEPYSAPSTVERRQDIAEVEAYDWRIERIVLPDGSYGVVCYFYDLSERQRWEAALRESEAQVADQKQVFEMAVSGASIEDVLGALAAAARRQFGSHTRTAFFLTDAEGTQLKFVAGAGLSEGYIRAADGFRISPNHPSCGLAAYTGEAVIVADVMSEPLWAPYLHVAREYEIGACWSFPMHSSAKKVIGTFAVYHSTPRDPDLKDLERLRLLAQTASVIIERHQTEQALRQNEEKYRQLFESMSEGFLLLETVYDDNSAPPAGYRFLDANPSLERLTGLKRHQIIGKDVREVLPEVEPYWLEAFAQVAATGQSTHIERFSRDLNAWYDVFAYRPQPGKVALIYTDVTHRRKAEQELTAAKAAAEEASRAKDHFLAVLSHELRTPLTPVLTAACLMLEDAQLPDRQRELLEMIRRNVELEARLIDDLLDLTRISRGKLELHMTSVDLHEKLQQVLAMCDEEIQARQLVVNVEARAAKHEVRGDAARLQQVLWNLLKNAVKFTSPGGTITVRTSSSESGEISVVVEDTGVGIEPEMLPRIFDPFEQGGRHITRQFGGLGLGLVICKSLVTFHGGSLTAHSDGPGKGARFTLALPTVSPQEKAAAEPVSQVCESGPARHRVLVVEDHPDSALLIARLLRRANYEVRVAHSVKEGLEAARAGEFDLLVSDIGLPDGTGLDLMEQLRRERPLKGIALSGYGMEEDIQRSKEAGFDAHLVKPVSIQKLREAAQQLLG